MISAYLPARIRASCILILILVSLLNSVSASVLALTVVEHEIKIPLSSKYIPPTNNKNIMDASRSDSLDSFNVALLVTRHAGIILTTMVVKSIFWGVSWPSHTGDKISGMDIFFNGYSGSPYSKLVSEYFGTSGQVGSTITYQGYVIDSSNALASDNSTVTNVLAKVCEVISSPDAAGNGVYFVFSDIPRNPALSPCGWHAHGSCGGVTVQFVFLWNLDGDTGCDPNDTSGLHSQGLSALANTAARQLVNTFTNPRGGGWTDSSGAEVGDKCAASYHVPLVPFADGSQWKLQGEWSNAAFVSGAGYAFDVTLRGCVDGLGPTQEPTAQPTYTHPPSVLPSSSPSQPSETPSAAPSQPTHEPSSVPSTAQPSFSPGDGVRAQSVDTPHADSNDLTWVWILLAVGTFVALIGVAALYYCWKTLSNPNSAPRRKPSMVVSVEHDMVV